MGQMMDTAGTGSEGFPLLFSCPEQPIRETSLSEKQARLDKNPPPTAVQAQWCGTHCTDLQSLFFFLASYNMTLTTNVSLYELRQKFSQALNTNATRA